MSAQHTPGPWRIKYGSEEHGSRPRGITGAHHRGVTNWNSFSRATTEEAMANARLIAAAPELLAALIALADMAEPLISIVGEPDELAAALKAIAKATGAVVPHRRAVEAV